MSILDILLEVLNSGPKKETFIYSDVVMKDVLWREGGGYTRDE